MRSAAARMDLSRSADRRWRRRPRVGALTLPTSRATGADDIPNDRSVETAVIDARAVPWPVRETVGVRTARLETFADGVFAIAATLLVLELRVPEPSDDLAARLADLWPAYAAYVISFMTIGIIWVNHHALLEHCGRADRRCLYLNLPLLLAVPIVPF